MSAATAATGMPDGEYRLGRQRVHKCLDAMRLAAGPMALAEPGYPVLVFATPGLTQADALQPAAEWRARGRDPDTPPLLSKVTLTE